MRAMIYVGERDICGGTCDGFSNLEMRWVLSLPGLLRHVFGALSTRFWMGGVVSWVCCVFRLWRCVMSACCVTGWGCVRWLGDF